MPFVPMPLPLPVPIPWPSPSPGVGTPVPSPGVGVTPGIGIPFPTTTAPSQGQSGGFRGLFQFSLDWRFLGALLFILLTVGVVDEVWPEWVWPYVGLLLGSLTVANRAGFTQGLSRLVSGG